MVLLIALIALVIWTLVATVVEVRRDGYRAVPTDWTRVAPRDADAHPEVIQRSL
ncbi:MAG TPA: hypothetical protein VFF85_02645 [Microbacterium sp.]|nr:hypothetical protein [Microbacterium sp.]